MLCALELANAMSPKATAGRKVPRFRRDLAEELMSLMYAKSKARQRFLPRFGLGELN